MQMKDFKILHEGMLGKINKDIYIYINILTLALESYVKSVRLLVCNFCIGKLGGR